MSMNLGLNVVSVGSAAVKFRASCAVLCAHWAGRTAPSDSGGPSASPYLAAAVASDDEEATSTGDVSVLESLCSGTSVRRPRPL